MNKETDVIECDTEVSTISAKSITNQIDISDLLTRVIDKGPDAIQMLEGLLALQEKQQKIIALGEFNRAKSECQQDLPSVKKTRKVMNKAGTAVTYRYASLDDARRDCLPTICKNGFSDGWKTENKENGMLITYTVRHDLGHEESTSMLCPMEQLQYMNNIQRSGSTITYGKRYTFCDFWGIILDEDDDGRSNESDDKKQYSKSKAGKDGWPPAKPAESVNDIADRNARLAIEKRLSQCTSIEDFDKAEEGFKTLAWMNEGYFKHFDKIKTEWIKNHSEDDLPF